jgi:hypothetical protein
MPGMTPFDETDQVEALLDGAAALVGGKDPLALGDDRLRGLMQFGMGHCRLSRSDFRPNGIGHGEAANPCFHGSG